MDATLVTVTVLSMGMAAALSAIVWRMLRLERQRSNARVAALTAVALGEAARAEAKPLSVENDLPSGPRAAEAHGLGEGAMFAGRDQTSPWGPRLVVMAAVALIVASIVLF